MVRDRAPLGQTQTNEMSLMELKQQCDRRKGGWGTDAPQNGESETVCVQCSGATGLLNVSDVSSQVRRERVCLVREAHQFSSDLG